MPCYVLLYQGNIAVLQQKPAWLEQAMAEKVVLKKYRTGGSTTPKKAPI